MAEQAVAEVYYAKDGMVWKHAVERKCEDGGTNITIGFPVCRMHDAVGAEAAETVAALMNMGQAFQAKSEAR